MNKDEEDDATYPDLVLTIITVCLGLLAYFTADTWSDKMNEIMGMIAASMFITGLILYLLGQVIGPKKDNRYKSGYKDNESDDTAVSICWRGLLLIILGGFIIALL